jgi:hypothetical protein
MSISIGHNPLAYFGTYGAVVKAGERLTASGNPLQEAKYANLETCPKFDAAGNQVIKVEATDRIYLSWTAFFHNSALARKSYFTAKDLYVIPPIPQGLSPTDLAVVKKEQRAAKFENRCAKLSNAFTHTMNFTDTIGAILANVIFKLEPTRLLGQSALIVSVPLAVLSRLVTFIVGAVVICPLIAIGEGLTVTAVLALELALIPLTLKIILPGLCRLPRITGFAIYQLAKLGLYLTASALCVATSAVIDPAIALAKIVYFSGRIFGAGATSAIADEQHEILARQNFAAAATVAPSVDRQIAVLKEPILRELEDLRTERQGIARSDTTARATISAEIKEKEIKLANLQRIAGIIIQEGQDRLTAQSQSDAERHHNPTGRDKLLQIAKQALIVKFICNLVENGFYGGVEKTYDIFRKSEQKAAKPIITPLTAGEIDTRISQLLRGDQAPAIDSPVAPVIGSSNERAPLLRASERGQSGFGTRRLVSFSAATDPFGDIVGSSPAQLTTTGRFDPYTGAPVGLVTTSA